MNKCLECGEDLASIRRKFCSKKCNCRYYNKLRSKVAVTGWKKNRLRQDGLILCLGCNDYLERGSFGPAKSTPNSKCDRCRTLRRYGLTKDKLQKIVESQGNACAICRISFEERRMAVDHCHETGQFRGILCYRCNTALGSFNDDPLMLKRAMEYLELGGLTFPEEVV